VAVAADTDPPLSKEDLEHYSRGLANLSPYHVRKLYNEVHDECRMVGERAPSPKAIQRLVQVWRQLWEWSRR
jgi:hypothetical protein